MMNAEEQREIRREMRKLLIRADALGRRPTPVLDVIQAAKLTEPKQSLLSQVAFFGKSVRQELRTKLENATSKILAMVDFPTATIHLDPTIDYEPQRRFLRFHEVGHTLSWQRDVLAYLDDASALSPHTSRLFERQASFAAAVLAFQLDQFAEDARDYATGLAGLLQLASTYEMSLRASLWQYAETHGGLVCGFVTDRAKADLGTVKRLEVSASNSFKDRFGNPLLHRVYLRSTDFEFIATVFASQLLPLRIRVDQCSLVDVNGDMVPLTVEAYTTKWHTIVLLWAPEKTRRRAKRVVLVDRSGAPLASSSAA